jgi:hypothetical protein
MRRTMTRCSLAALLLSAGLSIHGTAHTATPAVGNTPRVSPSLTPQPPTSQGSSANPQIQALDQQIHTLRDQFKSQSEPLEAQLKALHDQFDPQLKSLEVALARLRRQGAYAA